MENPPEASCDPRVLAVEKFDAFTQQRNRLRKIAHHAGEWAGIPISIEGEELVIHPSYRWASIINKPDTRDEKLAKDGIKIRNVIWSTRYRCSVAVYEKNGRVKAHPIVGTGNSVDMELRTIGCSVAWGIEQESNALKLLGTLLKHHQFKYYLLTGQFLETSERSGVSYMFRKLRPTIAMKEKKGTMHVLACLCMHPIGYYSQSWAGAMCPTDDVIAHLMLMRGDEPLYWRRCNQHPAGRPMSGV